MPEIILIQISGEDKPGLTSSLTGVLAGYGIDILDIGQSVIHNQLVLGVLIRIPREAESAPVLKDIMFKGYEQGVNVKFKPIEGDKYMDWVSAQGKPRHIITLVGNKASGTAISKVANIIAENGLNIDMIHRLSGPNPPERRTCPPSRLHRIFRTRHPYRSGPYALQLSDHGNRRASGYRPAGR